MRFMWKRHGDHLARLVEAYAETVVERVSPLLMTLPASFNESIGELRAAMLEDGRDEYEIYEAVREEEARTAFLALDIHDHILAMSVAGLYHQWERTSRTILINACRRDGLCADPKKIMRLDHNDVLECLAWASGCTVQNFDGLGELEKARLLTNVTKHGEGKAWQEIVEKHPDFLSELLDVPRTPTQDVVPDMIQVKTGTFCILARGIAAFWRSVPGY